jgi:predicted amidohydrolase
MATVFLALIQVRLNQFTGLGADTFDSFTNLIAEADAALDNVKQGSAGLKVAMAPEYLFSDITPGAEQNKSQEQYQPITAKDKGKLYGKLEALSKMYPDLLLVAGTIFYQRGGSKGKGYNISPIVYGGKIIHKHNKIGDDRHLSRDYSADAVFTHKKSHDDPFFTCENVRFAVEICADQGRIRTLTDQKPHPIDILIFISAGAGLLGGSLPDDVQYVAHVDLSNDIDYAKDRANGVWDKNASHYVAAASTSVPQALGGTISVYRLAV